jgi:hypothetical protein
MTLRLPYYFKGFTFLYEMLPVLYMLGMKCYLAPSDTCIIYVWILFILSPWSDHLCVPWMREDLGPHGAGRRSCISTKLPYIYKHANPWYYLGCIYVMVFKCCPIELLDDHPSQYSHYAISTTITRPVLHMLLYEQVFTHRISVPVIYHVL